MSINRFKIEILNETAIDNEEVTARITIGDFSESFLLTLKYFKVEEYYNHWYTSLKELLRGESAVALMEWLAPGDEQLYRKSWILYRLGERIFIQEKLFIPGSNETVFDKNGVPVTIPKREVYTEDGDKISEWETTFSDIYFFLENVDAV